jgi:nicotinamide-nucleotide amidase
MIEALSRSDIAIATGGLGPTVDDPTREAAARAFNVSLEYHPELWQQILARFAYRGISPSENNQRQAFIPATAIIIENPVGTAPAFILRQGKKSLICLPGVPREMETLMQTRVIPFLVETYNLHGLIKVKVLHTSGLPESRVDQMVADFETLQNPTLGLLAHPGVVDIRISAKADTILMADSLIASLEKPVRERFGDAIFGEDDTTLVDCVRQQLNKISKPIHVFEAGPSPVLQEILDGLPGIFNLEYSTILPAMDSIKQTVANLMKNEDETAFYCIHWLADGGINCVSGIISSTLNDQVERIYKGPPGNGNIWVSNTSLDFLRRKLIQMTTRKD